MVATYFQFLCFLTFDKHFDIFIQQQFGECVAYILCLLSNFVPSQFEREVQLNTILDFDKNFAVFAGNLCLYCVFNLVGKVVTEPSTPSDSSRSTPVVKSAGTPSKQNANRTLLLGGRRDGHICVFNMDSGDVEFEIEVKLIILHYNLVFLTLFEK